MIKRFLDLSVLMKAMKVVAAAALLAGAGLLAVSPMATAACNFDDTCLYGNNDFKWLIDDEAQGQDWWSGIDADKGNNEMDSWRNKSESWDSCAADGRFGGGDRQELRAGHRDNNVAPWNSDEVSGLWTRGGC